MSIGAVVGEVPALVTDHWEFYRRCNALMRSTADLLLLFFVEPPQPLRQGQGFNSLTSVSSGSQFDGSLMYDIQCLVLCF